MTIVKLIDGYSLDIQLEMTPLDVFELECKGCLLAQLRHESGTVIELEFYEPTRLRQDIEADFESYRIKYFRHLIVLKEFTVPEIINAAKDYIAQLNHD